MREIETETQWRVTWYPPDLPKGRTRVENEARVRKLAQINADWDPVIETREVTVSDWTPLEEAADA